MVSTIISDTAAKNDTQKANMNRSVSHETLKLMYNILRENSANSRCRLAITDLAQLAGVSRGTAHRAIRSLAAQGLIIIEPARNVTEPNTILINDRGMASVILQIQDKIDAIHQELSDLGLLTSQMNSVPDEQVKKEAVFYRQLTTAIISASVIYDNVGQLIIDLNRLDPELRALFGQQKDSSIVYPAPE